MKHSSTARRLTANTKTDTTAKIRMYAKRPAKCRNTAFRQQVTGKLTFRRVTRNSNARTRILKSAICSITNTAMKRGRKKSRRIPIPVLSAELKPSGRKNSATRITISGSAKQPGWKSRSAFPTPSAWKKWKRANFRLSIRSKQAAERSSATRRQPAQTVLSATMRPAWTATAKLLNTVHLWFFNLIFWRNLS